MRTTNRNAYLDAIVYNWLEKIRPGMIWFPHRAEADYVTNNIVGEFVVGAIVLILWLANVRYLENCYFCSSMK
jgi:hypothetical protein